MKNKDSVTFLSELEDLIPAPRLLFNAPMSEHTTFKIGGPADYLAFPSNIDEVAEILKIAAKYKIPVSVLGNGSNVLVLDGGIRGIVIKFNQHMGYIRQAGDNKIIAGAGAMLASVCSHAAKYGLTGLEFAVGIPGSIGGAVFMNAGAYEGEMSQVVSAVTAVTDDLTFRRFANDEINFTYRHSLFQENSSIICEVELSLNPGKLPSIFRQMDDYIDKRQTKQPLEMASAGSTFKRPPGHYAGTLIESAGLKGIKEGGAQVSLKHAGFIVNAGGASAKDVLALIETIQAKVYEHSGVSLTPEVRVIGEP